MTSRRRAPSTKQPPPVTSFSPTGEEYDASTFGGIGDYMRRKRIKLQNQDSLRRNDTIPQIFTGHVMAVLGYTNPNPSILRQIVVMHGGVWRDFKDGGLTMVLATALPIKKEEELMGRYKFATPDWVLECVKQQKIVAWSNYSLSRRSEGQTTLGFARKSQTPKVNSSSAYREELVKFALDIIKTTPQKGPEWEIPDSDHEGGLENEREGLEHGSAYSGQLPEPLHGKGDRAPPSGQTPAKEHSEDFEEDYFDDIDEDTLWMEDPDGQIAPPSHQPTTRHKRNFSEMEEEEDEEEADVVCLIPIGDTIGVADAPLSDPPRPPSLKPEPESESESESELECSRPPPVDKINGADAYTVEALIGEKKTGKSKRTRIKFLVKWQGYDESEATWEWADTLRADLGSDVVDEMLEKYRQTKTPKRSQSAKRKRASTQKTSQRSKKRATSTQKTPTRSQQKMIFSQITKPSSQSSNKESIRNKTAPKEPAIQPSRHTAVQKIVQETLVPSPPSPVIEEPLQPPAAEEKVLPTGFSFMSFSTVCLSDSGSSQGRHLQTVEDISPDFPSTKGYFSDGKLPAVVGDMADEDEEARLLLSYQVVEAATAKEESAEFAQLSQATEVTVEDGAADPPTSYQAPAVTENEVIKDGPTELLQLYQAIEDATMDEEEASKPPESYQMPAIAEEVIPEGEASKLLLSYQEPVLGNEVAWEGKNEADIPPSYQVPVIAEAAECSLALERQGTQELLEIPDSISRVNLTSGILSQEEQKTPPSSPLSAKTPKQASQKCPAPTESPHLPSKQMKYADADISPEKTPVLAVSLKAPSGVDRTVMMREARTPEEFNEAFLSDPRVRNASVLNPDFLATFFKESRLHYLSTSKAELRSRLQKLEQKFPRPTPPKNRATRYVMHVDFDCFFAAVSTRDLPDLKDKPVAICHGRTEKSMTSEIASCNYAARAFGVKNGMWMAKAKELCPDIVTLGYELEKYAEASEAFYEVILSLGGERLQAVSVDEALVDISNLVCNEGFADLEREEIKAQELAQKIRDECRRRTRCDVSVGIGTNVLMARLAMRKAKPAGQYIIRNSEIQDFLDSLDVRAFPGIGRHTTEKITETFKSDSVLELRKIPKDRLQQALGSKTGIKVHELCRGIDNTLVGAAETPRESISIAVNWGVRFTNKEQAEEFLHRLTRAVEERMKSEGVKGRSLTFKVAKRAANVPFETEKFLGCGRTEDINKTFLFSVSTSDASLIAKKCIELLRGFSVSPGDIRGFAVGMKGLEDAAHDGGQQQLQFLKQHAMAGERPKISAPPLPELKPAAPVTMKAYVRPKVTTLFDLFGKNSNNKKPQPVIRDSPINQRTLPEPTVPVLMPPAVLREPPPSLLLLSPPPPPPPRPSTLQDKACGFSGMAPPPFVRPAPLGSITNRTPATNTLEGEESPFENPPNPQHAEVRTHTRMVPQRNTTPQVPLISVTSSTQYAIPNESQFDMSCFEHLTSSIQGKILEKVKAKEPQDADPPPDSQWAPETWNSLSPATRKQIRAEDEAAERRRAQVQAPARRNIGYSEDKQRINSVFNRGLPGLEQNPSLSKQGVSKLAINTTRIPRNVGKGRRKAVFKRPPPPVRQAPPEDHPDWFYESKAIGGEGYLEDFADIPKAERALHIANVKYVRKAAEEKEAAKAQEEVMEALQREDRVQARTPAIVIKTVRKPPVLSLSVGAAVRSTDFDAVRMTISAWLRAVDEDLLEVEARDEDLKKLCVFLEKVVVEERQMDKAVRIVRWFPTIRVSDVFQQRLIFGVLEGTVRKIAKSQRIHGLQF
ncbi:hypothetical protein BZA05DRAFT_411895 [Tricharina praecox]|uniref:uncharacterized protein n=1 Tax=Tricharina praecox TaxID=43433 RepID=UPI002221279D|nr:uncharacterized protein BZA05DRAFT_411895 [Tricharina praecox]KAI5842680.1 hypothetical protein BZA05DRAFT_411895 [Tricharina praecox]